MTPESEMVEDEEEDISQSGRNNIVSSGITSELTSTTNPRQRNHSNSSPGNTSTGSE